MRRHPNPRHLSPGARRRARLWRVGLLAVVALAGMGTLDGVLGASGGSSPAGPGNLDGVLRSSRRRHPKESQPGCPPQTFVPAFFPVGGDWSAMAQAPSPPSTVILDLTSLGAGTAPEQGFRQAVAALQARGVLVLGYSSTAYATRPIDQVVTDVRHYAAWYGVHDVFLDEVTADTAHLAYYQALNRAIRAVEPNATIWLNPGTYPARAYMSLGDVVMAFEGPWSSYRYLRVPAWAFRYPASRFAFTVYDTPAGDLAGGVWLARHRRGGFLYLTDGTGSNPYGNLPSYFGAEAARTPACATGG